MMPPPLRVVVASDKFKGSLTAAEVASSLARGIHRILPDTVVVPVPVADGGDGTLDAAVAAGFSPHRVEITGPTGAPIAGSWARRGDTAVVELANTSGLARLPGDLAPLTASTLGTGQAIAAAITAGCTTIVLGVGGSSSTDGGSGLAVGLGARVLDRTGQPVAPGGAPLAEATHLDPAPLRARLEGVRVVVATDVDNPLTGPEGAAAVYGPQKGASNGEVALLDTAMTHWADLVATATGRDLRDAPGAGAAGGAGFAALALLGAEVRSGIETVLDLVEFDRVAADADLVITGEGSLDEQSLRGKTPIGVLRSAQRLGVPVVAVCGRLMLPEERLRALGVLRTWPLSALEPDPAVSMRSAAELLERVGAQIAEAMPTLTSSGR